MRSAPPSGSMAFRLRNFNALSVFLMQTRRRPKIVRLRKGKVPDDSRFVETLVFLLEQARNGEVHGYAAVFIVGDDKNCKIVEGSDIAQEHDANAMLGSIRRMELAFIKRNFPED